MAELHDRVSIELIDAGDHKDRVILVLSKVKGLVMTPQQLVNHTPCTVALNVPREPAEKLKAYLEKAGAMVMLEGERRAESMLAEPWLPSVSPTDIARDESHEQSAESEAPALFEPTQVSEPDSASDGFTAADLPDQAEIFPLAKALVPPERAEFQPVNKTSGDRRSTSKVQQLFAKLPWKKKAPPPEGTVPESDAEVQPETETPSRSSPMAFLSKVLRPKAASRSHHTLLEEPAPESPNEETETARRPVKKMPDLFARPATLVLVGFLAGAFLAGLWGMMEINRMKQAQADYEQETAQRILQESATLKNLVQQRTQETQTLQQKNSELERQLASAIAQLQGTPPVREITPASSPAAMPSWEQDLIQSFEGTMKRQIQSLSKGYEPQKQAACSFQVLLDGNGDSGYAQVVKQFTTQFTLYDIRHNTSLLVPYVAEVKIPFQQEQKVGQTLAACQAEKLKRLDTPDHPEFGEYYGYWIIEYHYRKGQWVVNPTVTERNRDLYEHAFQKGSPEYAKFRLDTTLFPEFKTQP